MASQINLRNELSEEKFKKKMESERNIPSETKLLLAYDESIDLKILRNIGLDHSIKVAENVKADTITMDKMDKEFGEAFTYEMIKKIAVKYRLKFAQTYKYKGLIDNMAATHIKIFMDKHKLSYDTAGYADQFFILAPYHAFRKDAISIEDSNPMLFYKLDGRNGTHYHLIYKWGKDFSEWRYVLGHPLQNRYNFGMNFSLVLTALVYLILTLSVPVESFTFRAIWALILGSGFGWPITFLAYDSDTKINLDFLTDNSWNA